MYVCNCEVVSSFLLHFYDFLKKDCFGTKHAGNNDIIQNVTVQFTFQPSNLAFC